jgi:hypothetical protein
MAPAVAETLTFDMNGKAPTSTTLPADFCSLATIDVKTNDVRVDWSCIERTDREFLASKDTSEYGAFAHVMKAIRDGTTK